MAEPRLKVLTERQVLLLDRLVKAVSPRGEVCLKLQGGRVRFVTTTKRYDPNSGRVGRVEGTEGP
jgi:hypothetical protein